MLAAGGTDVTSYLVPLLLGVGSLSRGETPCGQTVKTLPSPAVDKNIWRLVKACLHAKLERQYYEAFVDGRRKPKNRDLANQFALKMVQVILLANTMTFRFRFNRSKYKLQTLTWRISSALIGDSGFILIGLGLCVMSLPDTCFCTGEKRCCGNRLFSIRASSSDWLSVSVSETCSLQFKSIPPVASSDWLPCVASSDWLPCSTRATSASSGGKNQYELWNLREKQTTLRWNKSKRENFDLCRHPNIRWISIGERINGWSEHSLESSCVSQMTILSSSLPVSSPSTDLWLTVTLLRLMFNSDWSLSLLISCSHIWLDEREKKKSYYVVAGVFLDGC